MNLALNILTLLSRTMKHLPHFVRLMLSVVLLWGCFGVAQAQKVTSLRGVVKDAQTGESLPFVQIVFIGTTNGTVSDYEGRFSLSNDVGDTLVLFKMMGYQPDTLSLHYGKSLSGKKILLRPAATQLPAVAIRPNDKMGRYRRKDNPAVELARKVIEHKDSNRLEQREDFSRIVYDKTTMALDDFHPNFRKHKLWKHFPFVEKYIDTTEFDETEILNISIRECLMQQQFRGKERQMRTLTTARRSEGLSQELESEDIDGNLTSLFAPIDIYENQVNLVSNQFVGPLSERMAITFYHYFITDTIVEDGERLVELSFAPARKESYGFIGQMYITLDGRYAVRRVTMKVSGGSNVNFVRDLTLLQTFQTDSMGHNRPMRCDTYGRMYINKRIQQVYIHQLRHFSDYRFGDSTACVPDSLFSPVQNNASLPTATKVRRKVWNQIRPIELRRQETVLDSFKVELMRTPGMKFAIRTAEVLLTSYAYTNSNHDSARFAIGPVYNFISQNSLEGYRFRIGGQSTARLNNRNFFNGYVAYGLNDSRFKTNINLIHTFEEKRRHPYEGPLGVLALSAKYDIESPGISFEQYDPDNILMQAIETRIMQYAAEAKLRLRRQWGNIGTDSWIASQHFEPANALSYYRYMNDGSLQFVDGYWNHEISASFTFTPNRKEKNNRDGKSSSMNLSRDRFWVSLTHSTGMIDGFLYNSSAFRIYKEFWLPPFGNIDILCTGGKVWNTAPLPKLIIPNGNASFLMADNAFNTMRPMEYIVDQHISLFATYHMRGLILSRIPIIKRLKLREVFSFNMLYGGLSEKNDPASMTPGLYTFPTVSKQLGKEPYMEYSIGVENILKVIRIDYVARINYKDGSAMDHGWRMGLKFTL